MEPTAYYSKDQNITHVPISHEEEIALFKRFYKGNPKNMSKDALEARDAILTNNLRYAASIAGRHASRRGYHAELTSAANAGLLKALESRRFRPTQGRFTTFATKYIVGSICAFFRVSCAVTFPASSVLPDWPEDGEDQDVDTLIDPKGFAPENLDRETVRAALDKLESTERQIVELAFFQGMNISKARHLIKRDDGKVGVSRQWATELRDRALNNLRIQLGVPQPVEQDADNEGND